MVIRYTKKIRHIFIIATLMLMSLNYGCSPSGILASGGATTMVVAEGDRSLGSVVDDATIKVNIAARFLNAGNNLFVNINTTVLDGRVLLTGLVENQEVRIEAVRLVWEVEGIKEVINEIEIGNRDSIKEYANDVWITTQARAIATKTIGFRETGSSVALPIFKTIIENYLSYNNNISDKFILPPDLIIKNVDKDNGKITNGQNTIIDYFTKDQLELLDNINKIESIGGIN